MKKEFEFSNNVIIEPLRWNQKNARHYKKTSHNLRGRHKK